MAKEKSGERIVERAAYAATSVHLPRRLRKVLCLEDFEAAARHHLPRPLFGYIAGAAEDNSSLRENREIFKKYRFQPRVLVDVSRRKQAFELFGQAYEAPFGVAPVGISAMSAYRGDIVLAESAHKNGIPAIMSGTSLISMEKVQRVAPHTWFQVYLPGDVDRIDALVDRIARAGFKTLVVTVDIPVWANRENNVRTGFSMPLRPSVRLAFDGVTHPRWLVGTFLKTMCLHGMPHFENSFATRGAPMLSASALRDSSGRDHLAWSNLVRIRERWKGNLVIKGILHPGDAKQAIDIGADGVVVSNHGGRQLDGAVAPLRVLPEIVEAVNDRVPVMMDSGVRRGSDVLKALALGAKCVFLGRPFMYAAAVAGHLGVEHAIELLKNEIDRNMAMLGLTCLTEVNSNCLLEEF